MSFSTYSCSNFKKLSHSQDTERTVSGAMSKRGQNTTSNDGTLTEKSKTHQSGDAQSVHRRIFVTKFGISGQSGERR